jgi:hypothetical protein
MERELLERAAKAAGIEGEWCEPIGGLLRTDLPRGPDGGCESWNALTDNGDAFGLLVSLGLDLQFYEDSVNVFTAEDYIREDFCNDPCAATRRAIVRAAAELAAPA